MRIDRARLLPIRIPFREGFEHAGKGRWATEAFLVELHSEDGRTGIGEILPRGALRDLVNGRAPSRAKPVPSRRKRSKAGPLPGDKLFCGACSYADTCRAYREGSVCNVAGTDPGKGPRTAVLAVPMRSATDL